MTREEFENQFYVDGVFDSDNFDWEKYSVYVAMYCPEYLDELDRVNKRQLLRITKKLIESLCNKRLS